MTNMPKYLYHYTSLETLALILNHRTLAFNSLLYVDDMEEAETADIDNFGKYIYVSCWTDVETESIAMWNMYTPNMQGVRIKLPIFPFKKYHYKAGQYHFKQDADTYINYDQLYKDNICQITPNLPELCSITYTQDARLRKPKVRGGTKEDVQRFLSLQNLDDITDNIRASYSLSPIGKFKSEDWSFQREWRYWLFVVPTGMQEMEGTPADESLNKQQEMIRRLENTESPPPYHRLYLELNEECVKQMEIVLGPRTTEAGRILALALLKEHGLEERCRLSSLRIR